MISPRGFTLVELTLAIAIMALLAFISAPILVSAFTKTQVAITTQDIIHGLERAQTRTIEGRNDNTWGVHFTGTTYTLFAGASYAARNTTYDELHTISSSIALTGLTDVIFQYRTGKTTNTGTVTVTQSSSGTSAVIDVNAAGKAVKL